MPAIPLAGSRVVVVGPGEEAIAKLRLFNGAPCELVWFTLDRADPAPVDVPANAQIKRGAIPRGGFAGARLVFIALDDARRAERFRRRAKRAGALVNVVDNIALCDFYTPALVDRGSVTVALSTGGAAPILVRDIRSALEGLLPKGLGLLAAAARDVRGAVRAVTESVEERRRFWEIALRGRAARLADDGDAPGVRRALLADLETYRSGETAKGVVHLVGAGPGDPELLTLKAVRLLRDADVIVYDRLVGDAVLERARRDAQRVYVGKTRGDHSVPQDQIAELLIEHAKAGRRVVRLKGGDSFIFGRGGEEVEALRAAGVEVHVVPGVSAALACAASAQTPLTHRDHAQAVTFITGQPKPSGPDVDHRALSAANHTVVVYMGVATAADTAKSMVAAGRAPDTPVAIVENGSRPQERIVLARLDTVAATLAAQEITGPAVIIIGEVARHALTTPRLAAELVAQAERSAA